jgi:hypothetical protein
VTLHTPSWLQNGQSNTSASLADAFFAGGFRFDFLRPIAEEEGLASVPRA